MTLIQVLWIWLPAPSVLIRFMSSDRNQAGVSEQYSRQPDFNIKILCNYFFFNNILTLKNIKIRLA
jgi:hypothetical protein